MAINASKNKIDSVTQRTKQGKRRRKCGKVKIGPVNDDNEHTDDDGGGGDGDREPMTFRIAKPN